MRALIIIICMAAAPVLASFFNMMQPSRYLDARCAFEQRMQQTSLAEDLYGFSLPPGQHTAFTVTAWMRTVCTNAIEVSPQAFWCADPIQYSNPDLLAGAGGHGISGGTNLTAAGGSIAVADFPWQPYTDATASNLWPRGVYTLDGWSSNAVTVNLGGVDVALGPGLFNRNAIPGADASVTITGTGLAAVGISQTPAKRFSNFSAAVNQSGSALLNLSYVVSNELTFCAWKFWVSGQSQCCRMSLGHMEHPVQTSITHTNAAPANGKFDSRGIYRLGLTGVQNAAIKDVDIFDFRVLPWLLSDDELLRIHGNSVEEINRRGIPQWR